MNIFFFELKKIWKQKKLIWLFLIIILVTSFLYIQNYREYDGMSDRAISSISNVRTEISAGLLQLIDKRKDESLTPHEEAIFPHLEEMSSEIIDWYSTIHNKRWSEYPYSERDFLQSLTTYLNAGGEFHSLTGTDLEVAIAKNEWMIENQLEYEDETYPLSFSLFLNQVSKLLFSFVGIVLLLLFFGQTISTEKEQNTWATLRTQPIQNWQLVIGKFLSLTVVICLFIIGVIGFTYILTYFFSPVEHQFLFPQMLFEDDALMIIPVQEMLIRAIVLFICAMLITFSLVFLISKWFHHTFTVYLYLIPLLAIGIILTELLPALQTVFNPFHFYQFDLILSEFPSRTDWLYPLLAVIWSGLFIFFAIILREKEIKLFSSEAIKKPFRDRLTSIRKGLTWHSFTFEWRKLIRKGLFQQSVVLMLILLVGGYFALTEISTTKEREYVTQLEQELDDYNENLSFFYERLTMREEQENEGMIVGDIDDLNESIQLFEKNLEQTQKGIESYEIGDWQSFYQFQLYKNELYRGDYDSGTVRFTLDKFDFMLDVSIAEKHWLMEHQIEPVFPGELRITMHDDPSEPDFITAPSKNRKYDSSGLYSIYHYFENYLYVIPTILMLFLVGGGFAFERGKKRTLQLLQTQPIKAQQIFLGKTFSAIAISFVTTIGLILLILLIGTIFNRFGDWYYPALHHDPLKVSTATDYEGIVSSFINHGFHFIPLGHYLIYNIILIVLLVVFVVLLANFLSVFIKHSFSVFVSTVLIIVGGFILSKEFVSITVFSPFTYFDVIRVTNGEIATLLNNPSINWMTGSIVLFVSIILLMVGGYLLSRKMKS